MLFGGRIAKSAATFPTMRRGATRGQGADGPSVHLSYAGSDQDLSAKPQGAGGYPPAILSRTPRSACSASTARANPRCFASWRGSTRIIPAKPGSRKAPPSAICEQEPQLDAKKTARENVMEGVAAKKALLDRYNEIASNYSDETADEMAKLQDIIDSQNLWDLDSQVDLAMDALRCPPDDADVTKLSGGERRRVALCRLLLSQPGPAAARRADQPSRRRVGELAGRASAQLSRRDPDRHPRPLFPRQCHRLDSRARPRPRHSL